MYGARLWWTSATTPFHFLKGRATSQEKHAVYRPFRTNQYLDLLPTISSTKKVYSTFKLIDSAISLCLTPPGVNFRARTRLQKNMTFTVLHDMRESRT